MKESPHIDNERYSYEHWKNEENDCGHDLDLLTSCTNFVFHILQEVDAQLKCSMYMLI